MSFWETVFAVLVAVWGPVLAYFAFSVSLWIIGTVFYSVGDWQRRRLRERESAHAHARKIRL